VHVEPSPKKTGDDNKKSKTLGKIGALKKRSTADSSLIINNKKPLAPPPVVAQPPPPYQLFLDAQMNLNQMGKPYIRTPT